jgi:N-formylglutamate amidohydrolase
MTLPVLLHIPHSATAIPQPYRADYVLDETSLAHELRKLTDLYTDELYQLPGATRAVFPVSRFLVDPERFAEDADESMAARGMGVLYTVTTELQPLRSPPDPARRAELLARYYEPHHGALDDWAQAALKQTGRGLLIDCHSYPSKALPYELENASLPRPQIGIGTDPFHTPRPLAELLAGAFKAKGYEVGLDHPFAGTMTPGRYYRQNPAIMAFMIEVRKDLYVDEASGHKLSAFAQVQSDLTDIMAQVAQLATKLPL